MQTTHTVTLIYGDGIGNEVVTASRKIIEATGVSINWEICEAGAAVFKKGIASGVPKETIDSIQRNRVALKGPLETPVGYGEKSANVTLRKLFELFANIRPVREFPGFDTPYSGQKDDDKKIDLVVVRENVEDLYAGVEYGSTPETADARKIITRKGCEKISRTAFELARSEGRSSVHCATKANILKLTEGLMKSTFEDVSKDYPDIKAHHVIVDNCAHQLVRTPEKFETIVTTNMNGDILSDLASGLVGGLGFAPGANLGSDIAIFEAVHGSAPKYAGLNIINPIAVLLSGVMMLRHLGEFSAAKMIEQAVFITLGVDNVLTQDVSEPNKGVSTTEFTDHIIQNLGKDFPGYQDRDYKPIKMPKVTNKKTTDKRYVIGVDIFIESINDPEEIGRDLENLAVDTPFKLKMISNRGVIIYPKPGVAPEPGDCNRCRFILKANDNTDMKHASMVDLLNRINEKYHWVQVQKLNVFDGKPAFSKAQGED